MASQGRRLSMASQSCLLVRLRHTQSPKRTRRVKTLRDRIREVLQHDTTSTMPPSEPPEDPSAASPASDDASPKPSGVAGRTYADTVSGAGTPAGDRGGAKPDTSFHH